MKKKIQKFPGTWFLILQQGKFWKNKSYETSFQILAIHFFIFLSNMYRLPVVETIVDTSNKETRWHCYYRCPKHTSEETRPKTCKTCSIRHELSERVVKRYIKKQLEHSFPAPQYVVERQFVKVIGVTGLDPHVVYRRTKFQGFRKIEYVAVGRLRGGVIECP